MGLEAQGHPYDDFDISYPDGLNKKDFGASEEEQRKGLWRSIFGYFRGPRDERKTSEPRQLKNLVDKHSDLIDTESPNKFINHKRLPQSNSNYGSEENNRSLSNERTRLPPIHN